MLYEFTMYGSRYKANGLYYNTRPSISAPVDNPIVWDNADENVYVDYNNFRLRNSAVLKVDGYDYKFCFVSRGQGYVVRFENNNPYTESYAYNRTSGKGLYTCDSITTQTINGVTIVYNDSFDPSGKSDIVIDPNLPYFTDPQEFVNFITGTVQPPYTWSSVPSISGKNGILQSLVQIKEEAINDGEPVSEATVLSFDSLGNVNIPSVIDEQMPVDPSSLTSVTITYLIPMLEYGSYSYIKLAIKKNNIPLSLEDADRVVDLDEPATITRIGSAIVSGLDELSHYYFVIFIEDEQGNTASSEPKSCTTGEVVLEDMTTWDTVSGKDMTVEYANGVNHISGTANGTWEYWWKELSVENGAEYRVTCQVMSTFSTTYFSHYDRIYMLENAYPGSQDPQGMAFAYGDYFPNGNGAYIDYTFTFIAPANTVYICTGFGNVWTGYGVDFYIKDLRLEKI